MINRGKLLGLVRKSRANGFKNQPLRTVVLWHTEDGGRDKSVSFWDLDDPENENDDQMVSRMMEAAETDSAGLGDKQNYAFCFYFGEASPDNPSRGYGARYAFPMHGAPSFDDSASDASVVGSSMGSTPQGIAKLATGFTIDMMRLTTAALQENARMMQNQISRLEGQNEKLMQQRDKMLILNERMISRKFQRDLMLKKYQFWEEQKAKAAELLFSIAPAILVGLAGRKMLSAPPPNEQTHTFEDFIRSIQGDTDVLAALQTRLSPTQLPAVFQMAAAVGAGEHIQPAVLKSFLESIDEPQMDEFKRIMKPEQYQKLAGAIRAALREFEAAQARLQELKQTINNRESAEEDVDGVLPDDEDSM